MIHSFTFNGELLYFLYPCEQKSLMDTFHKILQILDAETYANVMQDAGILADVEVSQVLHKLPFILTITLLVDDLFNV